jgi:hypothetical protein
LQRNEPPSPPPPQQQHVIRCEVWLCDANYEQTRDEQKRSGCSSSSALDGSEAVKFMKQVLLLLQFAPPPGVSALPHAATSYALRVVQDFMQGPSRGDFAS